MDGIWFDYIFMGGSLWRREKREKGVYRDKEIKWGYYGLSCKQMFQDKAIY